MTRFVIVGRAKDCNLVLADESVSGHHAKLSWRNGLVQIEDLSSANGVWVAGQRVHVAAVRPGDEVLLGHAALPWSRPELRAFLRAGTHGTRVLGDAPPPSPQAARRRRKRVAAMVASGVVIAGSLVVVAMAALPDGRARLREGGERVSNVLGSLAPARSDEEAHIRQRMAPGIRAAIDPTDPVIRTAAVRLAARQQGTFRVEQVAAIWGFVRERWRYVNDPQGREYFANARETINNNYAGDCDDFAITLAAMVGAIGGNTRVIIMEGPRGGHAYTEACIREEPTTVATKLAQFYGRAWSRYAPGGRRQIAFRRDDECPVWLNLDWNAAVPGGDYEPESWAVAVYPDGHTETLAAAGGANTRPNTPATGTASQPRTLPTPVVTPN